jgi:hypothetical protein
MQKSGAKADGFQWMYLLSGTVTTNSNVDLKKENRLIVTGVATLRVLNR